MLWLPYANERPGVWMFLHELGLSISSGSTRTCVGKKSEQCSFARRKNNWWGGFTELGVGRDLWRLSHPTHLLKAGSARADSLGYSKPISNQFLNGSKYWDSTSSVGDLFLYLAILTIKKCFLIFKLNFLHFYLCLLPLVLLLVATEKSLSPSALHSPIIYSYTLIRPPRTFSPLG